MKDLKGVFLNPGRKNYRHKINKKVELSANVKKNLIDRFTRGLPEAGGRERITGKKANVIIKKLVERFTRGLPEHGGKEDYRPKNK